MKSIATLTPRCVADFVWESVTSHSMASAREQPLEVVRVHTLPISSGHLLYFECTLQCRVSTC